MPNLIKTICFFCIVQCFSTKAFQDEKREKYQKITEQIDVNLPGLWKFMNRRIEKRWLFEMWKTNCEIKNLICIASKSDVQTSDPDPPRENLC